MEKLTKKSINNMYKNKIEVGYCALQYLLYFKNRSFYTAGVYGWNADIYQVNWDTVIITGYRPFGNIQPDYDLIGKYENKAKRIINTELSTDKAKKEVNKLLDEFIQEITK